MDLENRITGCLLGLAVGDALGAPLEFMSPFQIQIRHSTVRDMIGGGWLLLRPGEWTEETGLALELGRSLAESGSLDPADVARRYADFYRANPKQVTGTLRTALALLAEGRSVEEAARAARELSREESESNGALCRAVPLAIFFADRDRLIEATFAEAGLTHGEETPRAAAVALAVLVSLLLDGTDLDDVFDRAWDVLEENGAGVPNVLPDVPTRREEDLRPTADALGTLEVAVWHFLRAPSFEEAVVRTANLGGDADATAAIAGALAGALRGEEAIPRRWLRSLSDRNRIRALAKDLAAKRGGSGQG